METPKETTTRSSKVAYDDLQPKKVLKKGDKIITIGGIYGTITDLSEKTVKVEIAEGVEITMVRSAVSNFQDPNRTQSE